MVQYNQMKQRQDPNYIEPSRSEFRSGKAGQLPKGLHNQGASTYVFASVIYWYSWLGWASTAPLLKVAQGPPRLNPALEPSFVGIQYTDNNQLMKLVIDFNLFREAFPIVIFT